MALTEKGIIDFARFEIYRARKAAEAGSIQSDYHEKEADVLSVLLESYIRLNTLEREALLRGVPVDKLKEPEVLRSKNYRAVKK